MNEQARASIGHLYPDATVVHETTKKRIGATTIAWIWARTVTCPNPACGIEMPLARSWWLSKKKGKEAFVVPTIFDDKASSGGRRVEFTVGHEMRNAPNKTNDGTISKGTAMCVACGSTAPASYLREQAQGTGFGRTLMAVVAAGNRRRVYAAPTVEQVSAATVDRPGNTPDQLVPTANHNVDRLPMYGMPRWSDAFTNRQLVALTTFSDLVSEVRAKVLIDALNAELASGARLADGGTGAEAYADAVVTYLAMAVSKLADWSSSICSWIPQIEGVTHTFPRHVIPMTWDYAEINPLSNSVGNFGSHVEWVAAGVDFLPANGPQGVCSQADAASRDYSNAVVSTDPPYYDNIGYSDLSDFFYVWLRRSLRDVYPALFASMLAPKAEELVANPYRHNGKKGAEEFFEEGFENVFARARQGASEEFPITVYYAFKQSELQRDGITSTGWATILEGMIRGGWAITATWPVRTERAGRMIAVGTNALASSIVLVLRPRHETAGQTTRRGFLAALRRELPPALEQLRQGAIAPVDLAQATIGPGMAVYSSFTRVVENDGTDMRVKSAIALINQAVGEVLDEQLGDLDADTLFCLKWYEQYGWEKGPFGAAESLAVPHDISVQGVADSGVLTQGGGIVQLVAPQNLKPSWDPTKDDRISVWEVMCHLGRVLSAEDGGLQAAGRLMAAAATRSEIDIEAVQRLAYRLYEITKTSRTEDARLFNLVGGSWTDVVDNASRVREPDAVQATFEYGDEN